ncbi:hypothetical protein [Streptomyces rhizosphaericus]|uniref:Uncharacterized protein n=1 Tax=Streptomyces rhizosphaericus TaxID=114699 RepID=A0A6G4ACM3_9ACTN|nr:hypothetical protein [Streptomyces rhizosphaericus]NEW70237.1 hypothetical protein [Streptomyces rhizosphaericus]
MCTACRQGVCGLWKTLVEKSAHDPPAEPPVDGRGEGPPAPARLGRAGVTYVTDGP